MPHWLSGVESAIKAPNVPVSFIAQKTEGFSGADLAELCQRAAKAAIRDAIAADELKAWIREPGAGMLGP